MGFTNIKLCAVLPILFMLFLQTTLSHAADGEPPDPLGEITVTVDNGLSVTAEWDSVPGAKDYHVNYSMDNHQTWLHTAVNLPDTTFALAADNALTYTAADRIRYAGGYSVWSSPATSGPFQSSPTPTPTPVSAPVDV